MYSTKHIITNDLGAAAHMTIMSKANAVLALIRQFSHIRKQALQHCHDGSERDSEILINVAKTTSQTHHPCPPPEDDRLGIIRTLKSVFLSHASISE
jgi:hypothetical protein